MMDIYSLRTGMVVMHQGEIARVEKVKQKRLIVQHADGRRYDTWPANLSPAPEGATFTLTVPEAEGVYLGSVIKFRDGYRPGMFVVIGIDQGNTYKATSLFGTDKNRYVRNIAATTIEVVSPEAVKEYLDRVTV